MTDLIERLDILIQRAIGDNRLISVGFLKELREALQRQDQPRLPAQAEKACEHVLIDDADPESGSIYRCTKCNQPYFPDTPQPAQESETLVKAFERYEGTPMVEWTRYANIHDSTDQRFRKFAFWLLRELDARKERP